MHKFLDVRAYINLSVHTYIHVYIVYTCMYVCTDMYAQFFFLSHTNAYTLECSHMYIIPLFSLSLKHTQLHTHTNTSTHKHIQTHMHTDAHIYTHVHTNAYTLTYTHIHTYTTAWQTRSTYSEAPHIYRVWYYTVTTGCCALNDVPPPHV